MAEFFTKHPVITLLLGLCGVDIAYGAYNTFDRYNQRKHVEAVNEQRMRAGLPVLNPTENSEEKEDKGS